MKNSLLRGLPKVDPLLESNEIKSLIEKFNRESVKLAIREAIDFYRENILNGNIENLIQKEEIVNKVEGILNLKFSRNIKKLINATGIVIHTNLGRSILSENAIKAVVEVAKNYSNLEYNLETGMRGSRYDIIESSLINITGAESAIVVNNNAAAVMLILNEMAKGKEAVISRGELVEIGGSFRIPDVMESAGVILKEVGATNRTHLKDYENAINENTGLFLKVHSSNFRIIGFTKEVKSEEITMLSKKYKIPSYEDLGSGVLLNLEGDAFKEEKTVKMSLDAGIDIVSFSGDKMLGGPQAGIIVGKKEYIDRIKKNPLTRAFRIDKFSLAALEATLIEYLNKETVIENIPTLSMILKDIKILEDDIKVLYEKLIHLKGVFDFNIKKDESFVGGGAMPGYGLETYVIEISSKNIKAIEIEKKLRDNYIPIIARVKKDKLIMDIRTINEKDYDVIVSALEKIGEY